MDSLEPEFSWQISEPADSGQVAYRVQVAVSPVFDLLLWDSGRVESTQPFGVRWLDARLTSRTRYFWRVSLELTSGTASDWSEPSWFETGLLEHGDWEAEWISGPPPASTTEDAALYFSRSLDLSAPVRRARAYVSALGWYHFLVNGHDLTADTLVPRWTPLAETVEYQVFDLTELVGVGPNAIGIAVGDGRYRGRLGLGSTRRHFGDRLATIAQIEIELEDGSMVVLGTDSTWAAGGGRILGSDPKFGERVDLRVSDTAWISGRGEGFAAAQVMPAHHRQLVAEEVERVTSVARLRGTVSVTPSGKQLVDFGQNIAGVVRIRLTGAAGTTVRLTHSEVLTPEGELDEKYLWFGAARNWWQRDTVTLDGESSWYQPWFAYRGFRYLEIDGLEIVLGADDVEAVVLSTDLEQTGVFECSDERVTKLFSNIVWSMRSNFLDTPTDCPTRERAGWTGDAQVFAPTATRIMDVQAYFKRYLRNLAIEQRPDGRIPNFIPNDEPPNAHLTGASRLFEDHTSKSVGWGDASVIIPWTLYERYGDVSTLERQWTSMRRWVGFLETQAATKRGRARWFSRHLGRHDLYIIGSGFHYGEWLRAGEGVGALLKTVIVPPAVVATAYFEHSARLMSRIAGVLGKDEDAMRYTSLADSVQAAWRAAFVRNSGARIGADKQDDYVRALAFELLPVEQRPRAVARLVELIERAGDHVGTGFLSTAMLLPVLAEHGRLDVAYRLLLQDTDPSWLRQVELGATTTWETWAGYDKAGRAKSSHNHYSFGAVADWLFGGVVGITPAEPGYRRIRIAPAIGGGLTSAHGAINSPYGRIEAGWRLEGGAGRLDVTVPTGTVAEIRLGDGTTFEVEPGQHTFSWAHEDMRS